MNKKLSIIIPVFNEELTIYQLLQQVVKVDLIGNMNKELIIVNDGSTDSSNQLIEFFIYQHAELTIKYINNLKNKGKGFSVRLGIQESSGDFIIIQDADLEYKPEDYNQLLKPILNGDSNVVYGSRFLIKNNYKKSYLGHLLINKGITFLANLLTGMHLTDIQTCYKLVDAKILKSIELCENRFSFDHELTIKLFKTGTAKIMEVPISYEGRKYYEKKIGWKDGFHAICSIIKYIVFVKHSARKNEKVIQLDLIPDIG